AWSCRFGHLRQRASQTGSRTTGALLAIVARVLVLDRDHAVVARLAQRLQEADPGRVVLAFAAGDEMPGRLGRIGRRKVEHAMLPDPVGIELGVLAVRMADPIAPLFHDADR